MSRRHYKVEQSYIEWLKSLGCVFYAPLDLANGLKDLISGQVGHIPSNNNNCTVEWNEELQMYEIDNSGSYYAGLLWTNLNMFPQLISGVSFMKNQDLTCLLDLKIVTDPNYNYYNQAIGIGGNDNGYNYNVGTGTDRSVAHYISPYITLNMRSSDDYDSVGVLFANQTNNYMKNGLIYSISDSSTWNQIYYDRFGHNLSLCYSAKGNGTRTNYAYRNIYVFNRALDLQTIRKIQGYDTTN